MSPPSNYRIFDNYLVSTRYSMAQLLEATTGQLANKILIILSFTFFLLKELDNSSYLSGELVVDFTMPIKFYIIFLALMLSIDNGCYCSNNSKCQLFYITNKITERSINFHFKYKIISLTVN
jgi:hypothetical protein